MRKTTEQIHRAVHGLLSARCDAVLKLDAYLRICEPTNKFAAIFGSDDSKALEGTKFADLIVANEDRQRFEDHCFRVSTRLDESESGPIADVLHVVLRSSSCAFAFNARLFQVPFPDIGNRVSHLVGICRGADRPDASDAVAFANLGAGEALGNHRAMGASRTGPNSNRSFHLSENSAGTSVTDDFVGDDGGAVRAILNVLSPKLTIHDHSEAWAAFCGTCDDAPDFLDLLGDDTGRKFLWWVQPLVNKQIVHWSPYGVCRLKFGGVTFRSRQDGLAYKAKVTLTLPDPLVAYDPEDESYLATVSLERLRLLKHQPWQGGTVLNAVHEK